MKLTGRPAGKHAAAFVFVTMVLDAIGIGLIIPVMPELIAQVTGDPLAGAARWGGALAFTYAIMMFVFGPTLGSLSDRFGRRPVLLVSVFMLSVDYLIMALAPTLVWLFIGRALSGLSAATHATAAAFMADISTAEERARNFGLLGAAFGVGFIVGPTIGGFLGEIGPRAPFYGAAAIALLNFIYGALVLPETLKVEDRRPFDLKRANPFGAARQIVKIKSVAWFALAFLFLQLAFFVYPSVWAFYTREAFGWSSFRVGLSLAAVGVGFALVQGVFMGRILGRLGSRRTALLGLAASVIALAGFGLAPSELVVWMVVPISALGAIATPALNGLMSNQIAKDAQGELQGALAGITAITTIVSPVMMTQVFAFFADAEAPVYLPGAPFVFAAVIVALAYIPFRLGARHG